jgi:regulator of sigma D
MNTGIAYYPNLVQEMVHDHRVLLEFYGDLSRAAKMQDYEDFTYTLANFKKALTSHLLKEAIKLYIYLRQKLKSDPASYQLISSYKIEMDGITKVAMAFIDDYSNKPLKQVDFAILNQRLAEIGHVLGDRIRREEAELYPLYHDDYE